MAKELIFSGQGVFFRTGLALGRGYAISSCMIPEAAGGGFWALSAAAVAHSRTFQDSLGYFGTLSFSGQMLSPPSCEVLQKNWYQNDVLKSD